MRSRLTSLLLVAMLVLAGNVGAQQYPVKPIRIVAPFTAGGTVDLLSRLLGQRVSQLAKQPVVIENRPGAGGNIGMEVVARSAPDGYTLVMGSIGTCSLNQHLYASLGYNVERDFVPVMYVGAVANLLVVNPGVAANSVKELVALAKAKPGKLTYASSGFGSSLHLAGELFNSLAGVDLQHVPYKGSAPAINDIVGGQINVMFDNMPSMFPQAQAGKVRPLAVTGAKRSRLFPNVPTMQEAGYPGFVLTAWFGVLVPAKTPPPVVAQLNAWFNEALKDPTIQKRLADIDFDHGGGSGADFTRLIKSESDKWGKLIRDKNIKAE